MLAYEALPLLSTKSRERALGCCCSFNDLES
jgi:hypothetical protein